MNRWRWAFSSAVVVVLAAIGSVTLASVPDANGVGPPESAGSIGPPSFSGYMIVRYSETVQGAGRFGAAVACPTGKVAIGWDAWAVNANGGGTGNVALGILSQNGDATQATANQVNFSIDADFTQPVNGPGAIHASVVCIKAA
jgi:hypothetical protein